jgi:hypothetical protein
MPKYRIEPVNKKSFTEYGIYPYPMNHVQDITVVKTWRFGSIIIEADEPPDLEWQNSTDSDDVIEFFPDELTRYHTYPFTWEFEYSSDLVDEEWVDNTNDDLLSERLKKTIVAEEEDWELGLTYYEIKCPFTVTEITDD